jgi:hypothetical protein
MGCKALEFLLRFTESIRTLTISCLFNACLVFNGERFRVSYYINKLSLSLQQTIDH